MVLGEMSESLYRKINDYDTAAERWYLHDYQGGHRRATERQRGTEAQRFMIFKVDKSVRV